MCYLPVFIVSSSPHEFFVNFVRSGVSRQYPQGRGGGSMKDNNIIMSTKNEKRRRYCTSSKYHTSTCVQDTRYNSLQIMRKIGLLDDNRRCGTCSILCLTACRFSLAIILLASSLIIVLVSCILYFRLLL